MSFTYYLLQLPSFILLLVMMLAFAATGAVATYFFRRYIRVNPRKLRNEMMGHFFGLLGGIYGLLLGFVVVLVWGAYNDTQANAAKEESLALSLYREIDYFPDSAKAAPFMHTYLAFVHSVVEKEYPLMEKMQPFTQEERARFSEVYRQLEILNSNDPNSDRMIEHLDQLAMYRSLRELGAYTAIPTIIWIPLLIGYFILVVCALFLDMESVRMHILVNGLLGAFTGLVIYIILLVNHPFSGSMKIVPEQYKTILLMASEKRRPVSQ